MISSLQLSQKIDDMKMFSDSKAIIPSEMFFKLLDKIADQVRRIGWSTSKTAPPTPCNSFKNLAEIDDVVQVPIVNIKSVRDRLHCIEKRVYKRSDPIDIVYPKRTW
ncbi:hypothetical protein Q1695_001298 [Nippostrongylus brasiliensis]|nr:hypothetical protein Q1695_001298 [Nippostrongylus brasiliensis]